MQRSDPEVSHCTLNFLIWTNIKIILKEKMERSFSINLTVYQVKNCDYVNENIRNISSEQQLSMVVEVWACGAAKPDLIPLQRKEQLNCLAEQRLDCNTSS